MKDNSKRIEELEFEYKGEQYMFYRDEIEYKNQFGHYCSLCEIPISYTKYANDKEVIEFVCRLALSTYFQGVADGKVYKSKEIRQILGIRE